MVAARATVEIVGERTVAHLCPRIQRNHRVHRRLVALVAARDQLRALFAAKFGKPVAVFAGAGPIAIFGHIFELAFLDVALTFAIFGHLEEITRAFFTLESF